MKAHRTNASRLLPISIRAALACAVWLAATSLASRALAEQPAPAVELGAPFADNAVLQRDMPVPVWGWCGPGTKVTVEFAGQKKTATAGKDGKWMLTLDPLAASAEPREMLVTEGDGEQRALENILVGEVWLASGQSNMQWIAGKSSARQIIKQLAEKAGGEEGKLPPIREFTVTNYYSALHPIERAEGEWKDGNFDQYSAIAFAFAHKLYEELQVPIGILNCSFSSTKIEAWTPREGFAGGMDDYTRAVYRQILEADPTTPEHEAAWNAFYERIEQTLAENAERAKESQPAEAISTDTPGNLSGNRDACWLFNARLNPVIPYAIRGGIWNQGYANIGGGLTYYTNLHDMIRGWRACWDRPELPVYFHQFYCPGRSSGEESPHPSIGSTAEMRLGTAMARDIPHADMASQIDIEGAIHYGHKTVPGRRLARHALKNQYGKDIVANGPMFKSYEVEGDKLIVEFDHADGGLVVAETRTNAVGREEGATGFADPKIIPGGEDQVKLFYLADENRVWHPAKVKIDGKRVVLTAPGVKSPRGVSYGTGGVGFRPGLYNRALLPMTPFIQYDHQPVTSRTWPDDPLKIAGYQPDPSEGGKQYEYRKMPLLSAQFRDNAVLQAGRPVTIWGSAVHDWGYEADGEAVITFRFAGIEKVIPVTPGMREWQVTLPAMEPSAKPRTLHVKFEIDGQLVHERIAKNIVFGDVWYVAGAAPRQALGEAGDGPVRVMTRQAKRTKFRAPSRYSICVSTTPKNRFAAVWRNPDGGIAAALGEQIHAKTGQPVGIVYMNGTDLELKHWIGFDHLQDAPSLAADYKNLAAVKPGNRYYDANARRYVAAWKRYWGDYIPKLMANKFPPDRAQWGSYPSLSATVSSEATQSYNVMVYPFSDSCFKGIIFLAGPAMVEQDRGAHYGEQLAALAASWKDTFAGDDTPFFYTLPGNDLAAKATQPKQIEGAATAVPIDHWLTADRRDKEGMQAAMQGLEKVFERMVEKTYR